MSSAAQGRPDPPQGRLPPLPAHNRRDNRTRGGRDGGTAAEAGWGEGRKTTARRHVAARAAGAGGAGTVYLGTRWEKDGQAVKTTCGNLEEAAGRREHGRGRSERPLYSTAAVVVCRTAAVQLWCGCSRCGRCTASAADWSCGTGVVEVVVLVYCSGTPDQVGGGGVAGLGWRTSSRTPHLLLGHAKYGPNNLTDRRTGHGRSQELETGDRHG